MMETGFDKTTSFVSTRNLSEGKLMLTVFDAQSAPQSIEPDTFTKPLVTFGRNPENDIVLQSGIVSKKHGTIVRKDGDWYINDTGSLNGLIYNNSLFTSKMIHDGDIIRIDDGVETIKEGVLLLFSYDTASNWKQTDWGDRDEITVGRDPSCDMILPHISVSKHHAVFYRQEGSYYLKDNDSTNGVIVNGSRVNGTVQLHEKDVLTITNTRIIFTSAAIYYSVCSFGMAVDAMDIVIERRGGRKKFITCNHVNLSICPGELVAIIGGSGAGKSTLLNAMCGYLPPSSGNVFINGADLYKGIDSLKKVIGYVPQQDIVFDNLTLYDMLNYTAKLRLPPDTTAGEREQVIAKAIDIVEMGEKRDSLIKSLSGGQRKRASIAVELLCDPNLIFLDEPASGLDPGTERSLMLALRKMADSGKTVILVTHSTLQLKLCDKIVFMGKGGNLCYFGSYDDAMRFFEVEDIVDVYSMITDHAREWSGRFREKNEVRKSVVLAEQTKRKKPENALHQFFVMAARNLKLLFNDRQRLLLLLMQAPLLSVMISIVADGNQFTLLPVTQNLLFSLSCASFWVGMLNSIQEICKERTILRREYMTGISLTSYVISKLVTLAIMCVVQSLLISVVFMGLIGVTDRSLIAAPFLELLITTFLTSLAAAAMGLFASSLFSNADRAMTVAPILLLPQILFSGLIFELKGFAEPISWITICRWSMEAYGSSADLNALPQQILENGTKVFIDERSFFTFTSWHLIRAWIILGVFVLLFIGLARIMLGRIAKEKS